MKMIRKRKTRERLFEPILSLKYSKYYYSTALVVNQTIRV